MVDRDTMLRELLANPVALSIRQPYPHHIFHDGKDVENRTWPTNYRGPVFVHAGKTPEDAAFCRKLGAPLGGIVGMVRITGCVTSLDSRWFYGPYGFTLADAYPLPFVPCRGALSLFRLPPDVVDAIREAVGGP